MLIGIPSTCGAATATATATGALMQNSILRVPQIYQYRSFSYPNVLRAVADEERRRKIGQRGNISSPSSTSPC